MQQKSKSARIGSIDGLRALSIIAILIYHLNLPWLPSGHMGVVVFLVLSGYFATTTLVRSHARSTQSFPAKLAGTWGKRLLRIMPSVVALIAIVATLCAIFNHVLLTKMRPDVLPSLGFFLNWSYIMRDVSYFDMIGGTSPLLHLWYIGVDLQFFLVWTLVLSVFLMVGKRFARVCALLLALASGICMVLLYVPHADPSRVYYGTDTRAFSLLLGSWLALAFPLGKKPEVFRRLFVRPISKNGRHTDGRVKATVASHMIGLLAFGGIVASMVLIPADSALWYRGGMFVFSLLTTFLVATMLAPGNLMASILGFAPLRVLGKRSFALYLWHYPIILLMSAQMSTTVWYLRLAAVGVALVAAELSLRLVEQPFSSLIALRAPQASEKNDEKKGPEKRRAKKSKAEARKERRRKRAEERRLAELQRQLKRRRVCVAVSSVLVAAAGAYAYHAFATTPDASLVPEESLVSTGVAANQAMDVSARREQAKKESENAGANSSSSSSSSEKTTSPTKSDRDEAKAETSAKKKAEEEAKKEAAKKAEEEAKKEAAKKAEEEAKKAVTVSESTILHAPQSETSKGIFDPLLIGDSVPGDAGDDLVPNGAGWDTRLPNALIDTFIGRSPYQSLEVLRGYMDQKAIGKIIVLACFSNSSPSLETLNAMMEAAGQDRQVFLVGTVNPDGFQDEANANLQETANRYANAHYVDWPAVLDGHLKEYLWADATHLRPEGAAVYVQMVVNAIAQEMVNVGGTTSEK